MSEQSFDAELEGVVRRCTDLLMALQRKEQLPRKFVASDWQDLEELERSVAELMGRCGPPGERFMEMWRSSELEVQQEESRIDTRELKRQLKLLARFQREYLSRPAPASGPPPAQPSAPRT